ncbi:phosphodiesterase [Sphingobium bisphenolivorans]|uniref:phosphodiesterase n=1 Tax=Sphingobium bisphenolivorans TaxID=1335760 RepID=UPI0003A13CFF|nr:phosphodiesterase [Sphingobium bisphenolivorans]
MLIAQVTDIHLGFEPGNPAEFNRQRLDQVLQALIDGPNRPDLLLATGDLTENGDADSYARLAEAFDRCPFPVWPCMGNHDDRANFSAQFPQVPQQDGFIHYVIPLQGRRIIMLDTLEPGRHGGAFCEARAAWLRARLDEDSETPTLIVMHHPPVEVGIEWMNTDPREPWVERFAATIGTRAQVQAILCGHIHRAIAAPWNGTTVAICSSSAPQLGLDLRSIDPETPDGRPMIIADAPAFALHRWTEQGIVSHFETAGDHTTLARFDGGMQPIVKMIMGERPD